LCLHRSGTEEQFDERGRLLTDLTDEVKEATAKAFRKKNEKSKSNDKSEKESAEIIRNAAMKSLVRVQASSKTAAEEPTKKRKLCVLELMEAEQNDKFKLQSEELLLKKRQLDLEERRLALQEQEQKIAAEERKQACQERQDLMKVLLTLAKDK
jgi:hypothetical protein